MFFAAIILLFALLELESGSNDPSAYTMTILFLSLIEGSPVFVPLLILKQVGYGLLFGFSMAYFIKTWLKYFDLKKDSLAIVFLFAIAFAIMAMNTGYGFSLDIYHLVFGICSLSLLLQGSLMPTLTRKLAMIDDQDSVLRTFNYYVDKGDISFIKTTIKEDSPFVGKKLAETSIQGDFNLAKIIRGGKAIVPRGEVVPLPGDQIVLIGEEYFDPDAHDLLEFTITKQHPWEGKKLQDLQLPPDQLVLSVHRNGEFLKAEGKAKLQAGDRVILFQGEGE